MAIDLPPRTAARLPTRGAAAYAVLTHRTLVEMIVAFQLGVPGLVAPLVHRFEREGWMERTTRTLPARGPAEIVQGTVAVPCVVSKISGRIWPPRQWLEQCALEASAAYDSNEHGFPVLGQLLDVLTATRSHHAREHVRRQIGTAAAAVGRVDVLQWMYDASRECFSPNGYWLGHYGRAAMRHGQVSVLEWIEATFGVDTLFRVVSYNFVWSLDVTVAAGHHQDNVLQWLQTRNVQMWIDGATQLKLIGCSGISTLRLIKPLAANAHLPSDYQQIKHAIATNQPRSLEYLVVECKNDVTVHMLEYALSLGVSDAVAWLLPQLGSQIRKGRGPALEKLVDWIRRFGHRRDSIAVRIVQLLLPLYPIDAVAAEVVERAFNYRFVQSLLLQAVADNTLTAFGLRALPPEVVAFARRLTSHELGPLASAALIRRWTGNGKFTVDIDENLDTATREDVQDGVLVLLLAGDQSLELSRVLEHDATRPRPHCDAFFLAVCVALCQHQAAKILVETAQRAREMSV